jgi:hypothetical protein
MGTSRSHYSDFILGQDWRSLALPHLSSDLVALPCARKAGVGPPHVSFLYTRQETKFMSLHCVCQCFWVSAGCVNLRVILLNCHTGGSIYDMMLNQSEERDDFCALSPDHLVNRRRCDVARLWLDLESLRGGACRTRKEASSPMQISHPFCITVTVLSAEGSSPRAGHSSPNACFWANSRPMQGRVWIVAYRIGGVQVILFGLSSILSAVCRPVETLPSGFDRGLG